MSRSQYPPIVLNTSSTARLHPSRQTASIGGNNINADNRINQLEEQIGSQSQRISQLEEEITNLKNQNLLFNSINRTRFTMLTSKVDVDLIPDLR
ncbi:uncharacterized protein BX663DRAFT_493906 [Cokeromyces recurvatus]|uniref:uncharacterized protein n=2 Tax=Cokeromyces recurvatus TaxID=90255 RepID=UPI00221E9F0C|nr:uncharacterized protein BX663DRAFT_528184 [Cokeromyces recurvatus]XP_051388335.1 uncharacterized protein BX663DRAFT_493906 [Cokeromyces recurvatus]KAI7897478.1 hypothetical protein BX663DRAFT_528184 [Cokeromyces recurvatus]KAI7908350.1 hypothetical protein BX663DRAFT_493906 [Cokeromyces recurvatus]